MAATLLSCGGKNSQPQSMAQDTTQETEIDSAIASQTELGVQEEKKEPVKKNKNTFEGQYNCTRSGDIYVFEEGGRGNFYPGGDYSMPSRFTWKKSGNTVTVNLADFGKTHLKYNKKNKTVIEESVTLGTLIFYKVEE